MTSLTKTLALVLAGAACVAGVSGCRGDRTAKRPHLFFPDLDDQPKWKPQSQTEFFADGRTMRQPPEGSVPFGRVSFAADRAEADWAGPWAKERADLLRADDRVYVGVNADGTYVESMPVPLTQAMIERGKERFNIYCAACHGYDGAGGGMVGRLWSYPLPSLHDPKYKIREYPTGRDGYLFHVSRVGVINDQGQQRMPGYAHALSTDDSWAIVAYIRALQETRMGSLDEVSESVRRELERTKPGATRDPGGAQ